jgi:ABC-2 type transport system permease protein
MGRRTIAVWFRSVFLKTLRDCRGPILGWGLGIGTMAPLIFALVPGLLADAQSRASVAMLVRNPLIRVFAEPVDIFSPGGYATWRLAVILPLVGVWALLATTRLLRGEEESGALDLLLSAPQSRIHVALAKLAAIATAIALIGGLIGLMAFAGGVAFDVPISVKSAWLFAANITLLAGVFAALALLASQFTTARRIAAGATGILLGLSMLLTSAGRTVPRGEWIGRLSPVYYFEQNRPLLPAAVTNVPAMALLAGLALVLGGAGIALFLRRDIGGVIRLHDGPSAGIDRSSPEPRTHHSWHLSSVLARSLASLTATVTTWSVVLAVYAAAMTAVVQQAQQPLLELIDTIARQNPTYSVVIARMTGGSAAAVNARALTAILTVIAVVFSGFTVTLASRWVQDTDEGRLDLVLATPCPRAQLITARFAAVLAGLVTAASAIFTGVALTAWALGFALDPRRLAEATFGMVPMATVVAAIGYLLAGWLRSAAVTGTLTGLLLASFVVTLLGPLFKWPPAVMQLSIFEQYGTPLVTGLQPGRVAGLLAVAAAALTAATIRFATRDLVR